MTQQLSTFETNCHELTESLEEMKKGHAELLSSSENTSSQLSEELEELRKSHVRLLSEYDILTQQQGTSASPEAPPGSPEMMAQARLEELNDSRSGVKLDMLGLQSLTAAESCYIWSVPCVKQAFTVEQLIDK